MERNPELTQTDLAERFGVTQAMVSYIFSFEQLPHDAISVIAEQPEIIGSSAVAALAGIAKRGAADRVIDAIKRLAAGEIDQGQAVKIAGQDPSKVKPAGAAPVSVKIRQGKATYCELRRARNVVRLEFKTDAEAERIQAALQALLEGESKTPEAAPESIEK
jgi:ParB family transcriptional regulator, chromosome partitioning protein